MLRIFTKLLLLTLLFATGGLVAQTVINPVTQINWPLITGAGTPTALSIGCTNVNYGQPFQNTAVTPNTYYTCGTDGWAVRGGSGGGAGITIGSTHVPDGGTITNGPGFNAGTATALAARGTDCPTGQYANGVDAGGNALCVSLPAQPGLQYIAPQALSGCGVEYVSGLTYTVGACSYSINNVTYNSPLTTLTLPTADPTNPRIDVIFVDSTQTVQSIQGTPAVTPQQPTVDPSTQLPLTFVLVPAGSTTPGNVTRVDIYLEGTEWTPAKGGTSAANVNLTSTNNPYQGTHDVEFGAGGTVATTTYAGFTDPSAGTVDLANYNNLVLYLSNKAAWPTTRSITVQWFNGATAKGTAVVISNGAFGFNATTNTTTYQQVSIPTTTFGIAGIPVTSVRVTVTGSGTNLTGFYMDNITLQGGSGGVILPSTLMNFKGTWNATSAYNPFDMVVSGGVGYVALSANTNVAVTNTAVWDAVGATGGNTTSTGGTNNTLPKFNGPASLINSLFTDDGTNGAYAGTGGITAPSFKTNGTVNGFLNLTAQGALPTTPGTGTVQLVAPNTVITPYALEVPSVPPPDSTHIYLSCTFANPSVCSWGTGGGGGGLSGMTAGQVPIAATATTVTSSMPLAGSGAGITTGPLTSVNLDCAQFTGTAGQLADSGLHCGGAIAPNAVFAFTGTSINDDDPHVLGPLVAVSSWTQTGSVVSFVNTGTNGFVVGDWVNARFLTGWPAPPSGVALGTGYTLFQVLSSGLSATTFQVNIGSLSTTNCSSSCGSIATAMFNTPFLTANRASFPATARNNTFVYIPGPVTIPGAAAGYATYLHPQSPAANGGRPGYLFINDHGNDDALCDSNATTQAGYQSLFSQAHTDGWVVIAGLGVSASFNQTLGCATAYQLWSANRQWLLTQGKSASNQASGQYWDILVDTTSAIPDGTTANLNGSALTPQAATAMSNADASAIFTGAATPVNYLPYYWGSPNSVTNSVAGATYQSNQNRRWWWVDSSGNPVFEVVPGAPGQVFVEGQLSVANDGCSGLSGAAKFCVSTNSWADVSGNWTLGTINIPGASSGSYVKADGTGFGTPSGGGTTTNALTMNNSGSGAASGSTFNGSAAQTISYNTIGAAPLASPTFTGTPAAPTATAGTSTTQLATTAFVQAAIAAAGTGAGIVTYSGPSLTFSGTQFFPIGGGATASATETNVDIDAPAAVTIQNMTVQMSSAPGVGNSVVYTWRKNAADTVLTCTISGASATSCSDTTHNFTTAALDLLDIKAVTTGTIVGTPTVVMAAQVGIAASGSTAFSSLSGGTNTTAAMVVGSGASVDVTGSGTINATKIGGVTVTGTPSTGMVPTATSSSAATWQAASAGTSSVWTIANVTSSRAINTIYHNTSGSPLLVVAQVATVASNTTEFHVLSDSSSTPSAQITGGGGTFSTFSGVVPLEFAVMPGDYYQLPTSAGASSIVAWTEYTVTKGSMTVSADLVGSKAYGTVYQNTSGGVLWIEVEVTGTGGSTTSSLGTDSSSSPSTIAQQRTIPGSGTAMSFFVPVLNNNYYELINTAGTGTITHWHEITWTGVSASQSGTLTARSMNNSVLNYIAPSKSLWSHVSYQSNSLGTLVARYDINSGQGVDSGIAISATVAPTNNPSGFTGNANEIRSIGLGVNPNGVYEVQFDNSGSATAKAWIEWTFN